VPFEILLYFVNLAGLHCHNLYPISDNDMLLVE